MKVKNRRDLGFCARPGRVVCFFFIHEIEKQCDEQSDAPHEPPSPILFPDCGDNQSQTARTHTDLWIPRSKRTSSDKRNEKTDSPARFPGHFGSGRLLYCLHVPKFTRTGQSLRPMQSLPFFLSFWIFVRHRFHPLS